MCEFILGANIVFMISDLTKEAYIWLALTAPSVNLEPSLAIGSYVYDVLATEILHEFQNRSFVVEAAPSERELRTRSVMIVVDHTDFEAVAIAEILRRKLCTKKTQLNDIRPAILQPEAD